VSMAGRQARRQMDVLEVLRLGPPTSACHGEGPALVTRDVRRFPSPSRRRRCARHSQPPSGPRSLGRLLGGLVEGEALSFTVGPRRQDFVEGMA
jgi:hypothetical protein